MTVLACVPRWDAPGCARTFILPESFFAGLQNERVYLTVYAPKLQAKREIFRYVEGFYNSRREHSALRCRPNEPR